MYIVALGEFNKSNFFEVRQTTYQKAGVIFTNGIKECENSEQIGEFYDGFTANKRYNDKQNSTLAIEDIKNNNDDDNDNSLKNNSIKKNKSTYNREIDD